MGEILKFPKIENDKQNVCAYVRISRKTGRVEDSFTFQSAYWAGKLGNNPRFNFLGVFGDEGISGRKTGKRKQFLRMLELAYNGFVNIIYVKSVQRFGRHIEDCIDAINKLKAKNVRVIFESDNIDTGLFGKDFALKCKAIAAEREAAQMSDVIRLKMNRDFNAGKVANYPIVYGYDINKETKKWEINKEQAEIIKQIFKWYLQGNGVTAILKLLHERKINSPAGNELWSPATINDYLQNERYLGHEILQRTYIENGKKIENKGEKELFRVENHHEPIISQEIFDRTQKEIERRANPTGKAPARYDLTSKIVCGHCGTNYRRIVNSKVINYCNVLWDCRKSNSLGKKYCCGCRITDDLLKEIIKDAYNEYLRTPHIEQTNAGAEPVFSTLNETSHFLEKGYITYAQFEESSLMQIDEVERTLASNQIKIGYDKNSGKFKRFYTEDITTEHVSQIEIKDFMITITFNNGQKFGRRFKYEHRKYARSI